MMAGMEKRPPPPAPEMTRPQIMTGIERASEQMIVPVTG